MNRFLWTTILFSLVLSACGPIQVESRKRFFWPPPPEEARIEYINYYFTDHDLLRGVDLRFKEAILGLPYPNRLAFQPFSVASDGKRKIYVLDYSGSQLLVYDLPRHESRIIEREKGELAKVVVDPGGTIWLLDNKQKEIRLYNSNEVLSRVIKLPEGSGRVSSLAVDLVRSCFYVTDTSRHRILVFDLDGSLIRELGERGNRSGEFNFPTDLDLDDEGNLYVLDTLNCRVQILSPTGEFIRMFGERGTSRGSFALPKGLTVSASGLVYVTDARLAKIVVFNRQGEYLLSLGGYFVFDLHEKQISPGGFYLPAGIDSDSNETLWVVDVMNGMLHEFQYLTADYLQRHPIVNEEIQLPAPDDYVLEDELPEELDRR